MVSIIVPMYNAKKYIVECLDSISSQDYRDIEILVIDDGSTDTSAALVQKCTSKDPRIRLFRQSNHGLVYSRKQGIQQASGEYVLFVDSDDWIEKDMVSELLALAKENDADLVASAATVWNEDGASKAGNAALAGVYRGDALKELKQKLFHYRDYTTMAVLPFLWNKLWKRAFVNDFVLGADEDVTIGEDVEIGFTAILEAGCVVVTDRSFYNYRKTTGSMLGTHKSVDFELKNAVKIYRYISKRCEETGGDELTRAGVKRFLINQLFTRAYPVVEKFKGKDTLFPFTNELPKEVVLYGAGEFGKELYAFLSPRTRIKYWIDRNAVNLRKGGCDVRTLDECEADVEDIVIVTVLDVLAADRIVSDLQEHGFASGNIKTFSLNNSDVDELISFAFKYAEGTIDG